MQDRTRRHLGTLNSVKRETRGRLTECLLVVPIVLAACSNTSPSPPTTPADLGGAQADRRGPDRNAGTDAAAAAEKPDAGPSCSQLQDEMVARLTPLSINDRLRGGVRGMRGTVDEPAPTSLWEVSSNGVVSSNTDSAIDIWTSGDLIESSQSRLAHDLDAGLAKRSLRVAYRPRWAERVGEARMILKALSAKGMGFLLIDDAGVPKPTSKTRHAAWRQIALFVLECDPPIDVDQELDQILRRFSHFATLLRRRPACPCGDIERLEEALMTITQRLGVFALTYDPRGRSLGQFKDDDLFSDVLRVAETVPLDERMRGVQF